MPTKRGICHLVCWLVIIGAGVMMYESLNHGNWIGGLVFFPIVIAFSVYRCIR